MAEREERAGTTSGRMVLRGELAGLGARLYRGRVRRDLSAGKSRFTELGRSGIDRPSTWGAMGATTAVGPLRGAGGPPGRRSPPIHPASDQEGNSRCSIRHRQISQARRHTLKAGGRCCDDWRGWVRPGWSGRGWCRVRNGVPGPTKMPPGQPAPRRRNRAPGDRWAGPSFAVRRARGRCRSRVGFHCGGRKARTSPGRFRWWARGGRARSLTAGPSG